MTISRVTKIAIIMAVNAMNASLPLEIAASSCTSLLSPARPYAGPNHGGAVPPVRIALRLRSARSRNGTWMANPNNDASRNATE